MNDLEKMNWIYSQLEDEESKFIFEKRRQFNLTGDYQHIWDIIDKYVPEFSDCKWGLDVVLKLTSLIKESGETAIIFGAGYSGRHLLQFCNRGKLSVELFCDNDFSKWGTKVDGLNGEQVTVISPEELFARKLYENHAIIISTITKQYYEEIYDMLVGHGVPSNKIYKFADYKDIKTIEEEQYFDKLLHFGADEVFVDGGCCDFTTSKIFLDKLKVIPESGCKKIYAFEPDKKNYEKCKREIDKLDVVDVELIHAGLWSKNTYLKFEELGNASSRLLEFTALDTDGIILHKDDVAEITKVVSLDTCISEKVTFIKLDVEGAELEALKGAEHILLRDKPKLSICVYHKKEDIYEIPYYIKTLIPEYKLFMRHYSNCTGETILYAVYEGD